MLNDTQLAIARQILNLGGKLDTKFSTMFIDEVESLQQQNNQMKRALEIVRDTLAHKVDDDRTSHSLWKSANDALEGGESNG